MLYRAFLLSHSGSEKTDGRVRTIYSGLEWNIKGKLCWIYRGLSFYVCHLYCLRQQSNQVSVSYPLRKPISSLIVFKCLLRFFVEHEIETLRANWHEFKLRLACNARMCRVLGQFWGFFCLSLESCLMRCFTVIEKRGGKRDSSGW